MQQQVYLPSLGRFAQMDPIEGGNANDYVYVLDPINSSDYSGQFGLSSIFNAVKAQVSRLVKAVAAVVSTARVVVSSAVATISKAVATITRAAAKPQNNPPRKPAAVTAPGQVDGQWLINAAKVERASIPYGPASDSNFDYFVAANSGYDWYYGGALAGGYIGCGIGAIVTYMRGGDGCMPTARKTSVALGVVSAGIGYFLGGNHLPGSGAFDWGPDASRPWFWE